jgi:hypothetical protein
MLIGIHTGNFHALMIIRNDEEMEPVKEAVHRLVHRALALDGTCELIETHPLS